MSNQKNKILAENGRYELDGFYYPTSRRDGEEVPASVNTEKRIRDYQKWRPLGDDGFTTDKAGCEG